jgi:hypothetical protein
MIMLLITEQPDTHILLPESCRQAIVAHCHQVLATYRQGGSGECKAFGLVSGALTGHVIRVAACLPLHRNVRSLPPYKEYMDKIMAGHAIPSETPLHQRGWVADPAELLARIRECRQNHHTLLGTYHMHRVGWTHDPVRDTPTKVDTMLAEDSRLLMFIVSMVDPARPAIRAFYEGIKTREIPIIRLESERIIHVERRKAAGADH